jgi:toxin CcdB
MARYDVYPSPDGTGYLLDLQTDLLHGLNTRDVAPLLPGDVAPLPAQVLNPIFELDDKRHVLATQFLSAVPASVLRNAIGNLHDRSDDITRAIDMVFQGF